MSQVRTVSLFIAATLFLSLTPTRLAHAQNNTPVGYWRVVFYLDNSSNFTQMATQHICFYSNNTWKGTVTNWQGRWFQKGNNALGNGDRVRLVGNYGGGSGNDSAELDFVNLQLMTGTWTEWKDLPLTNNSFYLVWTRVNLTFVSQTCPPPKEPTPPADPNNTRNPAGGREERIEPRP